MIPPVPSGQAWQIAPVAHYNLFTGRVCHCPWGSKHQPHWARTAGMQLNKLLKAPDKALKTPEGQRFLEAAKEIPEEFDALLPFLAQRFKKGELQPSTEVNYRYPDGVLHAGEPYEQPVINYGNTSVAHFLPNWHQWFQAKQHPLRRGVNIMDPNFTVDQLHDVSKEFQRDLKHREQVEAGRHYGKTDMTFPGHPGGKMYNDLDEVMNAQDEVNPQGRARMHEISNHWPNVELVPDRPYPWLVQPGEVYAPHQVNEWEKIRYEALQKELQKAIPPLKPGWHIKHLSHHEDDDGDSNDISRALEHEGNTMQHCIGNSESPNYRNLAREGRIQVYSLRDPRGMPHATWHYNSDDSLADMFGPSDSTIKPEYQRMLDEWGKSKGLAADQKYTEGHQEMEEDTHFHFPEATDVDDLIRYHHPDYSLDYAQENSENGVGENTEMHWEIPDWESIAYDYINHPPGQREQRNLDHVLQYEVESHERREFEDQVEKQSQDEEIYLPQATDVGDYINFHHPRLQEAAAAEHGRVGDETRIVNESPPDLRAVAEDYRWPSRPSLPEEETLLKETLEYEGHRPEFEKHLRDVDQEEAEHQGEPLQNWEGPWGKPPMPGQKDIWHMDPPANDRGVFEPTYPANWHNQQPPGMGGFSSVQRLNAAVELVGFLREADSWDSRQWPDPVDGDRPIHQEPKGCTCHEGLKLDCPVHGLEADPDFRPMRWSVPETSPVGYPQDQPRNWQVPYTSSVLAFHGLADTAYAVGDAHEDSGLYETHSSPPSDLVGYISDRDILHEPSVTGLRAAVKQSAGEPWDWEDVMDPDQFFWTPGHDGKWIMTPEGKVHLWNVAPVGQSEGGHPHHQDMFYPNEILHEGAIQPNGNLVYHHGFSEDPEVGRGILEQVARAHPALMVPESIKPAWAGNWTVAGSVVFGWDGLALATEEDAEQSAYREKSISHELIVQRNSWNVKEGGWSIQADKLHDFLMNPKSRPDLQTPEGQRWLSLLDRNQQKVGDKMDPLTPWLTREWKKGRIKHSEDGTIGHAYVEEPTDDGNGYYKHNLGHEEYGHWADFLQSKHPLRRGLGDIMQHDVHAFKGRVGEWNQAMEEEAHKEALQGGEVVHQWPDGWSVRQLHTPEELEGEGDVMGHCVGGYANHVARGRSMIYSLRDPKGFPHVTTEITPKRFNEDPEMPFNLEDAWHLHPTLRHAPEGVKQMIRDYAEKGPAEGYALGKVVPSLGQPITPPWGNTENIEQLFNQLHRRHQEEAKVPIPHNGEVVQIQGKANQEPSPEYQDRMREWFETFPPDQRPTRGARDIYDLEDLRNYGGDYDHYGLEEDVPEADWDTLVPELGENHSYPEADPHLVYNHALDRDEIPELAKHVEKWNDQVHSEAMNFLDYNHHYIRDMIGSHPEMDPDEDAGAQDRAKRTLDWERREQELQDELLQEHQPSQALNQMYKLLEPHYNKATGQYENAQQATTTTTPQPQQQIDFPNAPQQ